MAVSPLKPYCHTNNNNVCMSVSPKPSVIQIRRMYGSSQSTQALLPYICLLFWVFSNVYHLLHVHMFGLHEFRQNQQPEIMLNIYHVQLPILCINRFVDSCMQLVNQGMDAGQAFEEVSNRFKRGTLLEEKQEVLWVVIV